MSKVSEVRIQLPGGLIRTNIEVFCPQKPNGDAPDLVFQFHPKTSKKGPMPRPRKKLPNSEKCQRSQKFSSSYYVVSFQEILKFFARKSRAVIPRLGFLVSSQNVEKWANATTSIETTQLRTMLKVSEVRIELPGGLIPSNIEVFCPQNPSGDTLDSVF